MLKLKRKEALATTWACEKFSSYILGTSFVIETDHKPLVPLLGTKNLDSLPPRILQFRLKLDRFDYRIVHIPGKEIYTADTLSRAPISSEISDLNLEEEAKMLMEMSIRHLPASPKRLDEYRSAQIADHVCSTIINYCQHGWPEKKYIDSFLRPYWSSQGELTVHDNLLLYQNRIVVPKSLQGETLKKLHEGHQGIQRCRSRARTSVWWPGLSQQISEMIERCPESIRHTSQRSEPLLSTKLPDYPWQRVGTDLFMLNGNNYLLVADYFSRYPEVVKLKSTTSSSIIENLKSIFSHHGIPETIVSDNGPQFSSQEFGDFSKTYNFCHVTSSPHFPQSNGLAERSVQTMKRLLKESKDVYQAILSYRTTPLPWCNLSPAELLMGRQLRTTLPQVDEQLIPKWQYLDNFKHQEANFKFKQKRNYDRSHHAIPLPPIPDDTSVHITSGTETTGRVIAPADAPRSYMVVTPSGTVRRNRRHLNVMPDNHLPNGSVDEQPNPSPPQPIMTRSRTGTVIHPPDRL